MLGRSKCRLPPVLDMSAVSSRTMSWDNPLSMSYTVRAAMDAPIMASISTPVLWVTRTVQSTWMTLPSSTRFMSTLQSSIGRGWQKGIKSLVRFAACTPATMAVVKTGPFLLMTSPPAVSILAATSSGRRIRLLAVADLRVASCFERVIFCREGKAGFARGGLCWARAPAAETLQGKDRHVRRSSTYGTSGPLGQLVREVAVVVVEGFSAAVLTSPIIFLLRRLREIDECFELHNPDICGDTTLPGVDIFPLEYPYFAC